MTFQLWCMAAMVIICVISALDWVWRGDYANAVAFVCFGLGDLAIAFKTWGV